MNVREQWGGAGERAASKGDEVPPGARRRAALVVAHAPAEARLPGEAAVHALIPHAKVGVSRWGRLPVSGPRARGTARGVAVTDPPDAVSHRGGGPATAGGGAPDHRHADRGPAALRSGRAPARAMGGRAPAGGVPCAAPLV